MTHKNNNATAHFRQQSNCMASMKATSSVQQVTQTIKSPKIKIWFSQLTQHLQRNVYMFTLQIIQPTWC